MDGKHLRRRPGTARKEAALALAVWVGWVLACSSGRPTGPVDATGQAISITSQDLYAAYETNEVAADELYKGKVVRVDGVIDKIGKDIMNTPYVSLKTANIVGNVQAMFSESDAVTLANLSPNQHLKVRCIVDGKMMNVLLRRCRIDN